MPSHAITQTVAATFKEIQSDVHNDMINNNALLSEMEKSGNVRPATGGTYITENIDYAENDSFTFFSGAEVLPTTRNDFLTRAEYLYKQAAINIQMTGLEEIQNTGDPQLIELVSSKVTNSVNTMRNKMALSLYSDGTGYGGKELGGLQLLISDTPSSGTVGGISASDWAFWRNIAFDASTDGGAAVTSSNIQNYMDEVYTQVSLDADGSKTNLIVADNNYYNAFKQSLKSIQRITDGNANSLGGTLMYEGIPVLLDGGIGGACPVDHMYFINTDYLHLRPSSVRNYDTVGGERASTNQDTYITFTFWAGNVTVSSRRRQAVLKA